MSFKDRKRDDHGHVIGNDEVDGQKCKHQSGAAKQDFLNRNNAAPNSPLAEGMTKENEDRLNEAFDDDYEEEFNEPSPEEEKQYVDKCMEDIAKASDKKAFEYISGNIDDLTEAGLISGETSDRLMDALNRKIDEVNNDIDKDLMDAINMADDDILDEQFGKDTPERKLVGAMKQPTAYKKINDTYYPKNGDGKISDENKFSDEKSMKDVYGENMEESDKDLSKDEFATEPGYAEHKKKLDNIFGQYKNNNLKVTDFDPNSGYMRFTVNADIPPSEIKKSLKSLGLKNPSAIFDAYNDRWQIDLNVNKLGK